MNNLIVIFLFMFLLTACNERTIYTLKTNENKTQVKTEIVQLLAMLDFDKDIKIAQRENSIKISFKYKLPEEVKTIFDRIFNNSIANQNNIRLDKLTLIVTDDNKTKLSEYLRISKNKKQFEMTKKDKFQTQIVFPVELYKNNKSTCNLEVRMAADIPPLQVDLLKSGLTTKRLRPENKEDDSSLRYRLDYKIILNDNTTLNNVSFESIQIGIANDDPYYMSNLYFNYGEIDVDVSKVFINQKLKKRYKKLYQQCGRTILSKVTKDIQNLFITPKLSKMVLSYERKDSLF